MNDYQSKAIHEAARNLRVTIQQQTSQLEQVVMTLFHDAQSDKGTWGHTGSMESIVDALQGILDRFPAAVYTLVPGSLCVPETVSGRKPEPCAVHVTLTDAEQVERACMEG